MRYIIGTIIILVGLGLLLTAAGVKNVPSLDVWWPIILIVVGLLSWRSNPRMFFWPMILIALGVVFLLSNLNALSGDVWNYIWPFMIILLGFNFLVGKRWASKMHEGSGRHVFAAFSGREEKITGDFSKGEASAWFGGSKLDLREAKLADQSEIDVYAAFGGIEILVPQGVKVITRVTPIFGGTSNKTLVDGSSVKTITISGTVMFGGVDIKN